MPELIANSTPNSNHLPPSLYVALSDDPPTPSAPPLATAESGITGLGVPPVIDPSSWEGFPVFRETFLMHVTPPGYAAALRTVGEMLFSMTLESYDSWPGWPESSTRTELRAAVADLRHLQGFLASVGQERKLSSLGVEDAFLSNLAAKLSPQVGRIAGWIEQALEGRREQP